MLPCIWKQLLGIDCPMCGFQRSFVALLQGDVYESLLLFPALIPLLILAVYTLFHLYFRFGKGHLVIVGLFAGSAAIMMGSYTWNLVQGHAFH